MSQLDILKHALADGSFHHATFRNQGTLWEGLWFYVCSPDGFRGFEVAGCVNKSDPDYEAAYAVLAGTGIHVGSYGGG